MLRVVFFGTPDFATAPLRQLLAAAGIAVVGAYSQPDRRAGRGRQLQPTPVKAIAMAAGVPCFSPERLRDPEALAAFVALRADVAVVAAYGKILPRSWLAAPALGCLNVHASLLPRHRGANPIAQALLDGDPVSGTSLMQMDAGMDTGPVFSRRLCAIAADATTASLGPQLAELGAAQLLAELPQIVAGTLQATPQDRLPPLNWPGLGHLQPSLAPRVSKAAGRLEFAAAAEHLARRVRAFYPWPGTFVQNGEARLSLLQVDADPTPVHAAPGAVLHVGPRGLQVACGAGSLWIRTVRPASRGSMPATAWWEGRRRELGSTLADALVDKGVR